MRLFPIIRVNSSTSLIRWSFRLVSDIGFATLIYLSIFEGFKPAANITQFYIYVDLILSILNLAFSLKGNKGSSDKSRIPIGYIVIVNILFVTVLAGAGWFVSAAILLFSLIANYAIHLNEDVKGYKQCPFAWVRVDKASSWTVRCYREEGHKEKHSPPGELDDNILGEWMDFSKYGYYQ